MYIYKFIEIESLKTNINGVRVTATISNLGKTVAGYESIFLVDTGAIHCLAPKDELKKAGVTVEGKAIYELANGQPYEVEYGFARISFMGAETVVQVIFGPEKDEPLLGVVALENVGIGVDPVTMTLKKMPAIPLKAIHLETLKSLLFSKPHKS